MQRLMFLVVHSAEKIMNVDLKLQKLSQLIY